MTKEVRFGGIAAVSFSTLLSSSFCHAMLCIMCCHLPVCNVDYVKFLPSYAKALIIAPDPTQLDSTELSWIVRVIIAPDAL